MSRRSLGGWSPKRLEELASIGSGSALPPGLATGPVLVLGANGAIGTAGRANFGPGYLVGRVGAAGAVTRVSDLCWASDNALTVSPRTDSVDESFLGHLLRFLNPEQLATKNAQPLVTQTNLARLQALVPENKTEQHRIADILDTLDDTIRKTEEIIAKLQQAKRGLLHDLLTRGIDDNGELRDPERHPEQFKETVLGRVPKEWGLVRLEEVSEFVTSGSRGWASYYSETGPLFLRIGNLTRDHINLDLGDVVHVRPPGGGEGTRTEVEANDLVMSITADLGIVGVVCRGLGEAYVNQHIALVRLRVGAVDPRWTGHYLAGHASQKRFRHLDDPGAKAGLNLPTVRSLILPVPPRLEQQKIVSLLDAHDESVLEESRFRDKLSRLKQGLMDDLLTGRVRVPEAEKAYV